MSNANEPNQLNGNSNDNPLSELEIEIAGLKRQKSEIQRKNELIAERDKLQKELTFGFSESKNEAPAEPANVRRYHIDELPASEPEARALVENGIRKMLAHRKDLFASKREVDRLIEAHLNYYDAYVAEKRGKGMIGIYTADAQAHGLMKYIKGKNLANAGYMPFFTNLNVH